MSGAAAAPVAPMIRRLSIARFRGISALTWWPGPGLNLILGGGDVGKTTILDAIGLVLSPVNPSTLSDTDYFGRSIEDGFEIEAVMTLPADSAIADQVRPAWPWAWDGEGPVVPALEGDTGDAVYWLRVRGTDDLELVYEVVQPNGSTDSLPVTLRRSIGRVRLSGDDRNDRDLRLVQGSALDRLLSDKGLRSRPRTTSPRPRSRMRLPIPRKKPWASSTRRSVSATCPSDWISPSPVARAHRSRRSSV